MKDIKDIIIQGVHLDPSILTYANSSSLEDTSLDHALVTEASDALESKVTTIVAIGRCNTKTPKFLMKQ